MMVLVYISAIGDKDGEMRSEKPYKEPQLQDYISGAQAKQSVTKTIASRRTIHLVMR